MIGKLLNYYAGGNTARGYHDLFSSNLAGLGRLFRLKGSPGSWKSALLKTIGQKWQSAGYDIEYIHSPIDTGSVDGVLIRKLGVGIVDGSLPHVIDSDESIDIGLSSSSPLSSTDSDRVSHALKEFSDYRQQAYDSFHEALLIHDEWETYYIANMDYEKADRVCENLIQSFFRQELDKTAAVYHRFLGAATPEGARDFVPNLTENLNQRIFIKGRPGSGKSTMLKKIAAKAEACGFDTEIYHCGFDPNSLDMVIVREIGLAIFDSTAPHEYFPERFGDGILDMYSKTITPGTDEKYASEIKDVNSRYASKMKEAISFLAKASTAHEHVKSLHRAAGTAEIDKIYDKINLEISKLADKEEN